MLLIKPAIHQKIWKKITISTKMLSSKMFSKLIIMIRNVSWARNQHIRIISEGSSDTKDWSNDAEKNGAFFWLIKETEKTELRNHGLDLYRISTTRLNISIAHVQICLVKTTTRLLIVKY